MATFLDYLHGHVFYLYRAYVTGRGRLVALLSRKECRIFSRRSRKMKWRCITMVEDEFNGERQTENFQKIEAACTGIGGLFSWALTRQAPSTTVTLRPTMAGKSHSAEGWTYSSAANSMMHSASLTRAAASSVQGVQCDLCEAGQPERHHSCHATLATTIPTPCSPHFATVNATL